MALVIDDRVRETTTVTGTNDASLLGAVTGFQSFSVIGNNNTTYYTIADQAGGNWEVGIGTYISSGAVLQRTTVLTSSAGGAKVSFPAGTKDVFVTYPSDKAVYLDASGNVSPLGNVASGTWQATAIITTYGGTGLTTYTAGDLLYYNTGTTLSKLGIGTNGQALLVSGGTLAWGTASATTINALTITTTGGAAAPVTFDGSVARTIDYSTVGADQAGTAVALAIALG